MGVQKGLRLYQAIIDRFIEKGIEYEDAAVECKVDPDIFAGCFDATSGIDLNDLYEVLKRAQIDAISQFLGCSGFRIFLLADVIQWEDFQLISDTGLVVEKKSNPDQKKEQAGQYLQYVVQANLFGQPEFIVEQFIAATMSKTLAEACKKVDLNYRTLLSWKNKISTPELSDMPTIKAMAKAMDMGTPILMGGLNLLMAEDFILDGQTVNLNDELAAAMDIEIL
uniref:Uncharacterized protein n=1 Tax=Burkholderia sp. M701 TaxID=326454 RepID=V5YPC6_9BURK|nr:hypothetical protein [Burkholderia sp. M701]BAO18786.1 hypothetical protein [Burkholderia sp. M701]